MVAKFTRTRQPALKRMGLVLCGLILSVIFSGCATPHQHPDAAAERDAALERWHACLQRFGDGSSTEPSKLVKALQRFCVGHREDVVATYPIRLESEVDAMLQAQAQRHALQLLRATAKNTPRALVEPKKVILKRL